MPRTPLLGPGLGERIEDRFSPPAAPPPFHTELTWVAMDMADTFRPTTGDSERRNPPSVAVTRAERFAPAKSMTSDVGPGAYDNAAVPAVGKQVLSTMRSPPGVVFPGAGATERRT